MKEKKLLWIIIFNLVIIVSELLFGFIANSFALIADALHNVGDVLALGITYLALRLASVKASFKYTFGFLRAEMMAGFVNTLFLFVTMFYMIIESSIRLMHPEKIEPIYMIVVGTIALVANGVSAYLLYVMGVESCTHGHHEHHHNHEDTNIRSAYLHMFADALISVGVVIAGIVIYFFELYRVDSLLSIGFSIFILFHSFPLLKKSFFSLMDANRMEIEESQLKQTILEDERIKGYHDLHIYQPSSKESFISVHIILNEDIISFKVVTTLRENLQKRLEKLGFTHIVIQVDNSTYHADQPYCIKE